MSVHTPWHSSTTVLSLSRSCDFIFLTFHLVMWDLLWWCKERSSTACPLQPDKRPHSPSPSPFAPHKAHHQSIDACMCMTSDEQIRLIILSWFPTGSLAIDPSKASPFLLDPTLSSAQSWELSTMAETQSIHQSNLENTSRGYRRCLWAHTVTHGPT